jgi:NADH dehydrogenase [ubiquinone] 1 alpha subcomplex assembly factor 7
MIDIDDTEDSEYNFKIIKSPKSTAMTSTYLIEDKFKDYKEGERVDISPDCMGVMDKIAKYLDRNGGAGLAIDYGQDYIQGDTLRVCNNTQKKVLYLLIYARLLKTIKSFIQ